MTDYTKHLYQVSNMNQYGFNNYIRSLSDNSPRINGQLQLRQNNCSFERISETTSPKPYFRPWGTYPIEVGYGDMFQIRQELYHALGEDYPDMYYEITEELKSRLRAKVGDITVNLAELFATRMETIKMVSTLALRVARGARALKRRRFKEAASHFGLQRPIKSQARDFPGLWLEWRYGWSPLLGDIHTLLDNPFTNVSGVVKTRLTREYEVNRKLLVGSTVRQQSITREVNSTARIRVELLNSGLAAILS